MLSEFFQELSEKLYQDGFEVDNFYLKNQKRNFQQSGVEIYGEARRGFLHNYLAIYRRIKQSRPDVVISNFSYINPAILFGKLLGVKRNIAWFHTAYGHTKPNRLKVWNKTLYLNLADVVLANSKMLQDEMHSVYKVPPEKTARIPFWTNIINYNSKERSLAIAKNESTITIGCPGRLLPDKNQRLVIEALHHLKHHYPHPIRLYVAGDGPYRNTLEALVQELDLQQEVVFLGLLDVPEMRCFYNAMDVVVLPSFHEAFGLVFIEAIALGTPVVVSETFGAMDFIDPEKFQVANFSFNPHKLLELIDKLETYMNNQGLKGEYFKTLYNHTFDKDVIYNQIKEIVLNQPPL